MAAGAVDVEELAARATRAAQGWAPGCVVAGVEPLTGGASSLTFTADVGGGPTGAERIVLKVAPPGLEPVRNRDVARQARLMKALHGQPGVGVPMILFEDDGNPPAVSPFHAMNLLPGECMEPLLTGPPESFFPTVRDRAFAAARMLAALHKVDPVAVGLGAEPEVGLADEIARWTRAFKTVPEDMAYRHEEAEAALLATMPPALPTGIVHGDYRLGNMLCEGGDVVAIIDWEIWARSDPRIDLTWFLFFTDEAKHPMSRIEGPSGMPTDAELFACYVDALGHAPADIEWFHCLTRYKEAAATALLMKRAMKAAGDAGLPGDPVKEIQSLTVECIERLSG